MSMETDGSIATYDSPVGRILIKSKNDHIVELRFFDGEQSILKEPPPVLQAAMNWLDRYFSGKDPGPTPPLNLIGTHFRIKVWNILQTVPYGTTITYGEIAKMVADSTGVSKMSAQAIGNAVGHNPIAIMVPCHRVIGSKGDLTGYAYGIDAKSELLALEGLSNYKIRSRGLHPSGPQTIPLTSDPASSSP